jgi:hypothetical protein
MNRPTEPAQRVGARAQLGRRVTFLSWACWCVVGPSLAEPCHGKRCTCVTGRGRKFDETEDGQP